MEQKPRATNRDLALAVHLDQKDLLLIIRGLLRRYDLRSSPEIIHLLCDAAIQDAIFSQRKRDVKN